MVDITKNIVHNGSNIYTCVTGIKLWVSSEADREYLLWTNMIIHYGGHMKKNEIIHSKKWVFIVSVIVLVILAFVSTSYIFVKSYITKMNIITTNDLEDGLNIESDIEEVVDPEEISEGPDSKKEEIDLIESRIRSNMENNSTSIVSDKNVCNILLIGSDTRSKDDRGRSDAMIVVSINKKTKKIVATSILRDIYIKIPGKEKNNRINTAYANGGAKLLMDTIKQNFKIDIDRYVSINFFAFMDVIDSVGGVNINVKQEEIKVMNDYIKGQNILLNDDEDKDIIIEAGEYNLNGKQALGYARNRYVGTDFERTARQRRVLEQVFNKVKGLNIIELNDLLNIILPQVTTNLTEGEIFSLILGLPSYGKYSLEQWSIPVHGSYQFLRIRGMDVIGIDFEKNIQEILTRIYGY